jgi:flagellin-specific chaperone FliS
MKIADEDLDDFIAIYEKEFGSTLTRREAGDIAHRLLTLYELLLRKLPDEHTTPRAEVSDDSDPLGHPIGFRT